MIFKEDWWVVPFIIILGLLLLYHICTQSSSDSSNSGYQRLPQSGQRKGLSGVDVFRGSVTHT